MMRTSAVVSLATLLFLVLSTHLIGYIEAQHTCQFYMCNSELRLANACVNCNGVDGWTNNGETWGNIMYVFEIAFSCCNSFLSFFLSFLSFFLSFFLFRFLLFAEMILTSKRLDSVSSVSMPPWHQLLTTWRSTQSVKLLPFWFNSKRRCWTTLKRPSHWPELNKTPSYIVFEDT